MSFRDFSASFMKKNVIDSTGSANTVKYSRQRQRQENQKRLQELKERASPYSSTTTAAAKTIVLHGKVVDLPKDAPQKQYQNMPRLPTRRGLQQLSLSTSTSSGNGLNTMSSMPSDDASDTVTTKSSRSQTLRSRRVALTFSPRGSTRQSVRNTAFSELTQEIKHFQKMVANLESLLEKSCNAPEVAWRVQTLIRSVHETEQDLWKKLHTYEQSILISSKEKENSTNDSLEQQQQPVKMPMELRTAQAAALKLHRDFKRSHKALAMAMLRYEQQQRADTSLLTAKKHVPSSNDSGIAEEKKDDFFDRAMRETELRQINWKMHKVSHIYEDLAGLVQQQQTQIDDLQRNANYSKANAEAARSHPLGCLIDQESVVCSSTNPSASREMLDCRGPTLIGNESLAEAVQSSPFACASPDTFARSLDLSGIDQAIREGTSTLSTSSSGSESQRSKTRQKRRSKTGRDTGSSVSWFTPFETLSEDIQAVTNDLMDLGKEISNGLPKSEQLETVTNCGGLP